jgi:hypothetical protein
MPSAGELNSDDSVTSVKLSVDAFRPSKVTQEPSVVICVPTAVILEGPAFPSSRSPIPPAVTDPLVKLIVPPPADTPLPWPKPAANVWIVRSLALTVPSTPASIPYVRLSISPRFPPYCRDCASILGDDSAVFRTRAANGKPCKC